MGRTIKLVRGDHATFKVTVTDKDAQEGSNAFNISGCTLYMTWRSNFQSGNAIFLSKAFTITYPLSGVAYVYLTSGDLLSSSPNVESKYNYDVQITKPDGVIETLVEGRVTVKPEVTR